MNKNWERIENKLLKLGFGSIQTSYGISKLNEKTFDSIDDAVISAVEYINKLPKIVEISYYEWADINRVEKQLCEEATEEDVEGYKSAEDYAFWQVFNVMDNTPEYKHRMKIPVDVIEPSDYCEEFGKFSMNEYYFENGDTMVEHHTPTIYIKTCECCGRAID